MEKIGWPERSTGVLIIRWTQMELPPEFRLTVTLVALAVSLLALLFQRES